jgi:bifunctional DNA-binding transcriptional regulator/antitoxin component of YhaV-PrlF toxin-antitoxin module
MDHMSFIGKIISDGRITIPNKIRTLIGINDGDLVICSIKLAKSKYNLNIKKHKTNLISKNSINNLKEIQLNKINEQDKKIAKNSVHDEKIGEDSK